MGEADNLVPSSGRFERRCVVNDVVPEVVEESLVNGGKASGQNEDAQGREKVEKTTATKICEEQEVLEEQISQCGTEQTVEVVEKIEKIDFAELFPVSTDHPVQEQQPAQLETFVHNRELRNRTFSEGNHPGRALLGRSLVEDQHDMASALRKSLNHLCLGSFFKESSSQLNCGLINNCRSVIRRIRTSSSDRPTLTNISEKDQSFYPDLSPVPAKCSSGPLKSTAPPRKQVECPF